MELVGPLVRHKVKALAVQREGRPADAVAHPAHRGAQVAGAPEVVLVAPVAQDRLPPVIAETCHGGAPAAYGNGQLIVGNGIEPSLAEVFFFNHISLPFLLLFNNLPQYITGCSF